MKPIKKLHSHVWKHKKKKKEKKKKERKRKKEEEEEEEKTLPPNFWGFEVYLKDFMPITFSSPRAQPEVVHFFDIKWKPIFF